ncbi:MAG: hypothetical protein QM589_10025 [Thermomicrobiales bacterium]
MSVNVDGRDWYVFETIAADGTWSVGILRGMASLLVLVVAEGLTEAQARACATTHAWRMRRDERTSGPEQPGHETRMF